MSEDKCPFCGRVKKPHSSNSDDHCEYVGHLANDLQGVRSPSCYETELSQLRTRIAKLEAVAEALQNYAFSRCTVGPGCEENRQILLSIAIERLEKAGYLK